MDAQQSIEIASANPAAKLNFSRLDKDHALVSFSGRELQVATRVYVPDFHGMETMVEVFKAMAENWKGWDGEMRWASLEGEFGLVATSSTLGHVTLQLSFREHSGPNHWSADIKLTLEPMQVEQAHKRLADLYS